MNNLTPFGVNDLVPEEAFHYAALIDDVYSVFHTHGYQRIRTPSIEYFDSLKPGLGPTLSESAIKFFDPEGQVLILRPDHTTPIARMVATRMMDRPLPHKLCYFNSVFRNPTEDIRQNMETFQAGCEYIGPAEPKTDAEVIQVCVEALRHLGLEDIHVVIGHMDFAASLNEEKRKALLSGDYITFGSLPEHGDVSTVQDYPDLVSIHKALESVTPFCKISFNKGLVKGLGYYTGMVFDCYAKGFRQSMASGGRYDNLLEKFGFPCPAVGFYINMSALFQSRGIQ